MRKLLIKLVAIETALVGWLSYWLFLVYANNPSVADQLSSSLQKFPQLSFSTIDIAVLVIIAALAVTLAFKFQRGLRPGIRLERALQMLENLMKRNLILESQVAELKIEKSHGGSIVTTAPAISSTADDSRSGSWEKAFRTPLEAGPSASPRVSGVSSGEIPFGRQTGVPPPRIEPKPQPESIVIKPVIMLDEKGAARTAAGPTLTTGTSEKPAFIGPSPSSSSNWEDSPKFIGETKGILTPSSPPRKVPAVSESGGLRQPYIPAPVPKTIPPSVIVGPVTASTSPRIISAPTSPTKITARPSTRSSIAPKTSTTVAPRPTIEPAKTDIWPTVPLTHPEVTSESKPSQVETILSKPELSEPSVIDETEKAIEKTRSRDSQQLTKKKAPDEN